MKPIIWGYSDQRKRSLYKTWPKDAPRGSTQQPLHWQGTPFARTVKKRWPFTSLTFAVPALFWKGKDPLPCNASSMVRHPNAGIEQHLDLTVLGSDSSSAPRLDLVSFQCSFKPKQAQTLTAPVTYANEQQSVAMTFIDQASLTSHHACGHSSLLRFLPGVLEIL